MKWPGLFVGLCQIFVPYSFINSTGRSRVSGPKLLGSQATKNVILSIRVGPGRKTEM